MPATKRYIILTVLLRRDEKRWTAECVELGTAAFGDTLEEAQEAIDDLIELHLSGLEEHGERSHFFSQHGIEVHSSQPKETTLSRKVPLGSYLHPDVRELVPA